jgi:hypothetical protein
LSGEVSLEVALTLVGVQLLGKWSPAAVQLRDDVRLLLFFIATDDHQAIVYRKKRSVYSNFQ